MKTLLLCLIVALPVALQPGCQPPAARHQVVEVQTLKSVGQAADAAVALSAHLFADGKITAAQASAVAKAYDNSFQPAFRLAVAAAHADMTAVSPADVVAIASQLAALVASYQH